jgi:hypothetical protein
MWAREDGLWEYIKCNNCDSVLSKEDVFWYLANEIQFETVTRIEQLLWKDNIDCSKCWSSQTEFMFWNEYLDDIVDRLKNSESYLTVYKDSWWVIRWFVDWYIDKFSVIYKREFEKYYRNVWKEKIMQLIEETLESSLPKELFYCSAIWIETKYKNFKIIVKLLQEFFFSINDNWRDIIWISELKLWSSVHHLNSIFWAKGIWLNHINLWTNVMNHNLDITSDIFITTKMVDNYKKSLSVPIRELILKIKSQIN